MQLSKNFPFLYFGIPLDTTQEHFIRGAFLKKTADLKTFITLPKL